MTKATKAKTSAAKKIMERAATASKHGAKLAYGVQGRLSLTTMSPKTAKSKTIKKARAKAAVAYGGKPSETRVKTATTKSGKKIVSMVSARIPKKKKAKKKKKK